MKTVYDMMEENNTKEKMASFMVKEKQPYEFKVEYAKIRASEFIEECDKRG